MQVNGKKLKASEIVEKALTTELGKDNEYSARLELELNKLRKEEQKVFDIQNQALKITRLECPVPLRTPETCKGCGNAACFEAWKEQNKLWTESSDHEKQPASAVPTRFANTPGLASRLNAKSASSPKPEQSAPHGPGASGSDLFSYRRKADEAA